MNLSWPSNHKQDKSYVKLSKNEHVENVYLIFKWETVHSVTGEPKLPSTNTKQENSYVKLSKDEHVDETPLLDGVQVG